MSHNHSHHHKSESIIKSYLNKVWEKINLKDYQLEFVHDGETTLNAKENKIIIGLHEVINLYNELKEKNLAPKNEQTLALYLLLYNVGRAKHEERKSLHMMKYDLLRECRLSFEEKAINNFVEFHQNIMEISHLLETKGWENGYHISPVKIDKENYIDLANYLFLEQVNQMNEFLFIIVNDMKKNNLKIEKSILEQINKIKKYHENKQLLQPIMF